MGIEEGRDRRQTGPVAHEEETGRPCPARTSRATTGRAGGVCPVPDQRDLDPAAAQARVRLPRKRPARRERPPGVQDVTEGYRAAGIWIESYLDANRDPIENLSNWFTISCALLAVEVILWTVSVAG